MMTAESGSVTAFVDSRSCAVVGGRKLSQVDHLLCCFVTQQRIRSDHHETLLMALKADARCPKHQRRPAQALYAQIQSESD
jgi:hypothetical protein